MSLGRCVLITGGGSGIGAALAGAFHARGATVIIAGQTEDRLARVAAAHPGIATATVDVADPLAVNQLAARIGLDFPDLDTVISNAGVQTLFDFGTGGSPDPALMGREIDVNLKGVVNIATAFLPLLRKRPAARIVNVGSGLGYVPLATVPIYSATKAAVHSFTVSLRHQLRDSRVYVVELIPPAVETDLHRHQPRRPPGAMPLPTFTQAAMRGLDRGDNEIHVGLAKVLRVGSRVAPRKFFGIVNKIRD